MAKSRRAQSILGVERGDAEVNVAGRTGSRPQGSLVFLSGFLDTPWRKESR